jgi:hypothetical protein
MMELELLVGRLRGERGIERVVRHREGGADPRLRRGIGARLTFDPSVIVDANQVSTLHLDRYVHRQEAFISTAKRH